MKANIITLVQIFPLFCLISAKEDIFCKLTGHIPFSRSAVPPSFRKDPTIRKILNVTGHVTWNRAFSQMAAALLAIDDFNTRNATVIPELDDEMYRQCSVYVPENGFEVYDHDASVEGLVPKTLLGKSSTCSSPCAIVGPYTDQFAVKLSAIAEAWGIPLITHGAEENELSRAQFPMVFRSNTNIHAIGEAIIQFLKSKNRTDYLGGIYESKFGADWRQIIQNAAMVGGFEHFKTEKILPQKASGNFTVDNAMNNLKRYRTIFITLTDPVKLDEFADAAEKYEMNRGKHVYVLVIPHHFELDEIILQAKSSTNVTKLMNGAALVRVIDSFMYKPILGTNDPFFGTLDGSKCFSY